MKRRIATLLMIPILIGLLLITQGKTPRHQGTKRAVSFELSKYGTLLKMQVNGKDYGARPLHEGFGIGYRVGMDERYVYAYADQAANELAPDESSGQSSNRRVITTKDGVWRVTSQFSFNDRSGLMTIQREFENISPTAVQLLVVKSQMDDYLAGFDAEPIVRRARLRGEWKETNIPITAWLRGGSQDECVISPCDWPPGCCDACPICTMQLRGNLTRAKRPGVLFCSPQQSESEIKSSQVGSSLAMDELQSPYYLNLYFKKGTNAVARRLLPKKSATYNVRVTVRY